MSEHRDARSTRDRVLEAALACLVDNGYGGTTARAIAQVGGFAPGVIYYHFADLDDLLVAALERTSGARIDRYRTELSGLDRAVPMIARLRELYDEDSRTGHIAAVQELYAGARPGTRLAAQLALETTKWEDLAEEQLTVLLRGKPLASVVRVRVLAGAAVAFYLGMETLTHLDGDRSRPETLFAQGARLAAIFDRVPRVKRRVRRVR
ncbi:TetR/AcrR family transcriptional regulator [Streptomyces caniscabiei]|uniref:TetR/AcrR family transcriptional regulator n=1 Tax=Streptomyces caniscabiei TaxID=2746961 RepID=A0A927L0V3_9ACTN|nr:TetR/AcrR family transcriptional regulator [Streptomyces caniscabiei]MBD9723980.1 TetR/AcrR family transcriptional regulator [Streptomyces caniscabiei]MDX3511364.1 TetR/AcrR family transcriptional regulator [Streptomyces caniscabiei]MDX3718455.1 TetR/AcrR family transcriptional regulator [Streptomyces caniscabiei]MDX3727105.1 TetR/AcrR family transcriptional regulator [Streptomyces caniscabiei]WEO22139.1 TetR/AcrR family transcriptional regulator [Streptomyces caniscabiei]